MNLPRLPRAQDGPRAKEIQKSLEPGSSSDPSPSFWISVLFGLIPSCISSFPHSIQFNTPLTWLAHVSTFSPEIFCGALLGITLYWAGVMDSKMPRLFPPSSSNSLSTTWTCASSGPQAAAFGQISKLIPPSQTNKGTNELPSWRTISILFEKDWAETPEPCKLQALGHTRFADVHRYSNCIWWKYYWIILLSTGLQDSRMLPHQITSLSTIGGFKRVIPLAVSDIKSMMAEPDWRLSAGSHLL